MTPVEAKELLEISDEFYIKVNPVGNNCYRINIYSKLKQENSIMFVTTLVDSYYICQEDGIYKDMTIKGVGAPNIFR